jgi:lactate racemase
VTEEEVHLTLPYGDAELPLTVPARQLLAVVERGAGVPAEAPTRADEEAEIGRALAQPIGVPRLRDLAAGAASAVVVVSDVTRPCPSYKFLPALLGELAAGGMAAEAVTVVFALGGHRRHTAEEQLRLVGEEVAARVRLFDLDEDDCVLVGTTSRGTPLSVFRPYLEADLRVCTGNIEYHYFAGYSGGAKAVMPGICTRAAIERNHAMMLDDAARAGVQVGNPVREDIDEAGDIVGVDFLFNVLLDGEKRILRAVAGDCRAAHAEGVRVYDELFDVTIEEPADIVVASPGGRPKDLNLYQAQKTLDNVAGAVRPGGAVVLAARCEEGFGEPTFERWMLDGGGPAALVERIRRSFVLGGHKAAAIAGLLGRMQVYLVSSFPDDTVRRTGMIPAPSPQAALKAALASRARDCSVLVVPRGIRVRASRGAADAVVWPSDQW